MQSPDDCKSQAAKFNETHVKNMEDNDQIFVDRQLPAETKQELNYFRIGRSISMTTNYLYLEDQYSLMVQKAWGNNWQKYMLKYKMLSMIY